MMSQINDKQRSFAREYIIDSNAAQAAIRAGYTEKTARHQGYRLLTYSYVKAEVERLRALQRERLNISVEQITRQLQADRDLAHEKGQSGAAVSASSALAKLHGLIVDKREVRVVADMTDDEVESELAEVQRAIEEEGGETRH